MTDADLAAFAALFENLRRVFALRASAAELTQIQGLYFKAFRRYALDQVQAGADAWLARGAKFPKPHDWIHAIPREAQGGVVGPSPVPKDEVADLREAIRLGFVGDPCGCFLCQRAGVSHRFLRHVPLEDEHGRAVRAVLDDRPVTRGRWIHGEELRAWYAARDAFDAERLQFPSRSFPTPRRDRVFIAPFRAWVVATEMLACGFDPVHLIGSGDRYLVIRRGAQTIIRCSQCAATLVEPAAVTSGA